MKLCHRHVRERMAQDFRKTVKCDIDLEKFELVDDPDEVTPRQKANNLR